MRLVLSLVLAAACVHPEPPTASSLTSADKRALNHQGRAAYNKEDFAACSAAFERGAYWYEAAACHAMAHRADAAFGDLERAIAGQVRDFELVMVDEDLASLHADPRWATLVAGVDRRFADYTKTANAELFQLYRDDQADRMLPFEQTDWKVIGPRDAARRKRVAEILAAGGAKVADDYYHAAMVFQHGDPPDDFQRAHDLAVTAVQLDRNHDSARWLAAAALDRKLMTEHKPQKYGTQFQIREGVWYLWDVDPSVTDQERSEWNVPPLADAKARAAAMNARK